MTIKQLLEWVNRAEAYHEEKWQVLRPTKKEAIVETWPIGIVVTQAEHELAVLLIENMWNEVQYKISTGASPVKPDDSAGLSESRVTQTDPEKQLGLHDGIPAKPENTKT